MSKLQLSIAFSDYDHVRDLMTGAVAADGIDLVPLHMPVEEIFFRFVKYRDWDISEMSLAKFSAIIAAGDADITGLPVFPSRMFRISSAYVRRDSNIVDPAALAGKRIGIPEWAQTAAVYSRGWLSETVGVPLHSIEWVQAGVNEPGRTEKVRVQIPKGVKYTPVADRSLTEMLLSGDVDAVLTAHPPHPFETGDGSIRHLVPDHRAAEETYFKSTGIFPIMHVVAVRNSVLADHPWVARNLYKAFLEARARSVARLEELTASRVPLPWAANHAGHARALFGDLFPYGVEANRTTLEAFLRFAHDQGVTARLLRPEELFAPQTLAEFRI